MPRRTRLAPHLVIGLALPFLMAGSSVDENWQRLRSMPREHRLILAEKIREFDLLGRDEKARIRELDERIAALPAADQANYRAILRRYHIWLQSLPENQRKQLDAAPAGAKLAEIGRLRTLPRHSGEQGPSPLPFQLADLQGRSPFDLAHILEIWFKLSPEERAEVDGLGSRERLQRLSHFARQHKIPPPAGLTDEQIEDTLRDLEKNAPTKGFLRSHLLKKVEPEKLLANRRRMANNYFFLVHPPKPASSTNLVRFETAMPSWFRATFDHLPPEEARRRLTVLYRLIYPAPREIPASAATSEKPAEKEKAEPSPAQPGRRNPRSASPPI